MTRGGECVRAIGMDVHRDFCEVAIADARQGPLGRADATTPAALELFAASLAPTDRVALEATGNAAEIARIIGPHVARGRGRQPARHRDRPGARAKTDRLDARTLAKLLAAGELDAVWMPDERTRAMRRRLSRRSQLVRSRTRAKNEIHAVLIRRLKGRPPVSDVFGVTRPRLAGRAGAARRRARDRRGLPAPRRLPRRRDRGGRSRDRRARRCTSPQHPAADDRARRQRDHRQHVHRRDRRHPPLPQRAAAGRLPRPGSQGPPVRLDAGAHGRITKQGSAAVRHVLVEAAWVAIRAARPAARVLRARPRPPRRAGRGRRHRAQARQPVLVPAHPRAGLRLRPAVADPPGRSARSSSPPAPPPARARSAPATAPAPQRSATPNAHSPSKPSTPTAARSATGKAAGPRRRARA